MLRNIDSLIPKSQVDEALAITRQFFNLSIEAKERLAWECPESNRGYVDQGRERVTQESSLEAISKLRAQAPGQWPFYCFLLARMAGRVCQIDTVGYSDFYLELDVTLPPQ